MPSPGGFPSDNVWQLAAIKNSGINRAPNMIFSIPEWFIASLSLFPKVSEKIMRSTLP
jgi:hypothetical protein